MNIPMVSLPEVNIPMIIPHEYPHEYSNEYSNG